jgi:23S rRNA (cytidine1920-2'-O)/16S rRNA (cytidine1409-2'-O)-methyltransferase
VTVSGPPRPYVSRGGEKLAAALDGLGIEASGRRCLDAGASTGGFTDVLLSRGAAHVIAVDVGYGQLAWELRADARVTVLERTNVRDLSPETLPYRPSLVAADLSFISLTLAVPALAPLWAAHADLVLLVKPQFEARRDEVGPGGVVRDPEVWRGALERVSAAAASEGAGTVGAMASPLPGPAGNVEFFLHARAGAAGIGVDLDAAVAEGLRIREAS